MADPGPTLVATRIAQTHALLLTSIQDLSEEQIRWQHGPQAPSIRFHLWHAARWADKVQSALPGLTDDLNRRLGTSTELWESDGLEGRWGLTDHHRGVNDTGMGLDDEASASLPLPGKDVLLAYARRVFEAADRAAAAVDDVQFRAPCTDLYGRENVVGDVLLSHLTHVNRHLGMIEALRGILGTRGTATM